MSENTNSELAARPRHEPSRNRLPDIVVPLSVGLSQPMPPLDLPARLPADDPLSIRNRVAQSLHPEPALVALIDECHFIMREVALRCIVQSSDANDRLAFMRAAMHCAETGAVVGKAVAKVRGAHLDEDQKVAIMLEAEKGLAAKEKPESEKQ